ncbi:MAG: hypothetical protein DRR16_10975 [Candidatus Parabeggiatoa sp. nov. 3]|nr:MAG: hypothetical protein DRR00_16260 [Gammaproteobacteria bacterium]RKZ57405.1 MAG: hypothetical protein DRQ99_27000 [Gammaproteobacteria bacterium]RKZ85920.1 MAG: hypothetical protein DRR16_10975 [Gammaproteobacteria bacterium]
MSIYKKILGGIKVFKKIKFSVLYYWDRRQGAMFDKRYGVDTKNIVDVVFGDGPFDLALDKYSEGYAPISIREFRSVMSSLPFNLRDHVFVDLGSGYGRAMMYAASYQFQKIIGVEYVEIFNKKAVENTNTYSKVSGLKISFQHLCIDVTKFKWPLQETVVFMYNPFCGEILDRVLESMHHSLLEEPRSFWVLYCNAKHHEAFDNVKFLTCVVKYANFRIYKFV